MSKLTKSLIAFAVICIVASFAIGAFISGMSDVSVFWKKFGVMCYSLGIGFSVVAIPFYFEEVMAKEDIENNPA